MAIYVPPTGETDQKKQNMSLQLIGGLVSGYESAWTAFTPTLAATAGTYTTSAATGRYKLIGKTVVLTITVSITTVGTGTFPLITLPVSPLDINTVMIVGSEIQLTGKTISARASTATQLLIVYYDNSNPAASGTTFRLSGSYEAA